MAKTTEKPNKALSRTIPDSYWNGASAFMVNLTRHVERHKASIAPDCISGMTHYAACFLPKIAAALSRLDTLDCNAGLTERQERQRDRLTESARAIAASVGARLYRQSDPRGYPIRLAFPGMIPDGADMDTFSDRLLGVPC